MFKLLKSFFICSLVIGLGCSANAQLVDNGDGTITDTRTGLMWAKDANINGSSMTWDEAMSWVANLDLAGHTDWRLPSGENDDGTVCNSGLGGVNCTETEFWSIYQGALGISTLKSGPFENVIAGSWWTSTEWTDDTNKAMGQDMTDGGQNDFTKNLNLLVWPVRDVPGGTNPESNDVWIKDCNEDMGNTPSVPNPCPNAFQSPDIFIDNDNDLIIDAPVYGADNTLNAIVRNTSNVWAIGVRVRFYYRNNSTGLIFPDGANYISERSVHIPPNSNKIVSVLWRDLPYNPYETGINGHWCIGVVLDKGTELQDLHIDPAVPAKDDNNVAIANIWHLADREGEEVVLGFSVGSGGGFGFSPSNWPREFILEVENNLPDNWDWSLENIEPNKAFILKLNQEMTASLKIVIAEGTPPRSQGDIEVRQKDVETGRIVGGIKYSLYEDHHPPQKVQDLTAELTPAGNRPILTWPEVNHEIETGLNEKVSYYEVLRNKKIVAKVLRDEDPGKAGIQWTDRDNLFGTQVYSIKAVDEAGNVSEASVTAEISFPTKQANWLLWILLLIIFVLVIIIIRIK